MPITSATSLRGSPSRGLFAFAHAVHYGIWLRLIPEEDRPQATPRTFGASFRALEKDFGTLLLWGSVALMSGLAIWATLDLIEARDSYLRMALFHGYLELAAAALLFVEGRRGFEATREAKSVRKPCSNSSNEAPSFSLPSERLIAISQRLTGLKRTSLARSKNTGSHFARFILGFPSRIQTKAWVSTR